jgi:preprotein translocase subunit SecF
MAAEQKFTEIIKPGVNIDFIGKQKLWIGISVFFVLLTIAMLPLNAYVIPGRGQILNWGVDFRGGSDIKVLLSKPLEAGALRQALDAAGFHGADVIALGSVRQKEGTDYLIRTGAVASVSRDQLAKAKSSLAKVGDASLKGDLDWSEGGDKLYVSFDKAVEPAKVAEALKTAGVSTIQVQPFGRIEENTYEATLVSLESEVRKAIDGKLGAGTVKAIPEVASVGAKAGEQLRNDGIKAMIGAILLIVVYVAFRFDFRYGPGTIVALVHDAVLTIGAFAVTYKEFSLTTLAALLTIIGFSMNDTIVVFDRIRENVAKYRDRPFDKIVNQSVNETLSRTILTSATVFFVTLAMNVFGTGLIRDFAFAMNVGVIVGCYSSVFIASPVLIWLNDKYVAAQKRQAGRPGRPARQPVRRDEGAVES